MVNISKTVVLEKLNERKETLGNVIQEKQLNNLTSRVAVVLDKSGSMRKLFKDGSVQELLERLFPLALQFDDNGELDFWLFNDSFMRMPPVTLNNFHDYIEKEIFATAANKFWGQTLYAPVLQNVCDQYIERAPSLVPTYVIFITDGNNTDKKATKEILQHASHHNLFWQYVGIGDEKFDFLKKLDDLDGRFIDNANFFETPSLSSLPDNVLYSLLLNEYPSWLALARSKGMI
jgi:hypothetical protein